jgi:hypothetical protein
MFFDTTHNVWIEASSGTWIVAKTWMVWFAGTT